MPTSPKKTAKSSPTRAPKVVSVAGEPFGRFARVLAETRAAGMAIEPYEITKDLILYPPTPERVKGIDQYAAAHLLAQSAALQLVQTQGTPPDDPEERIKWAAQQSDTLTEAYKQIEDAETAYNEALFGGAEVYEKVNAFFADKPNWMRRAFEKDIKEYFLMLPVDGRCQACGTVVDPKAQNSANGSSGSSNDTGTKSTATSRSTSEESTRETGSGGSGPGTSSGTTAKPSPA